MKSILVSFQQFDPRCERLGLLQDPEWKNGLQPANASSGRVALPTSSAQADAPNDEQRGGPYAIEHHAGDLISCGTQHVDNVARRALMSGRVG